MQLRVRILTAATSAVFLSACGEVSDLQEDVEVKQGAVNQSFAQHQTACQADPRVQSGVVSLTECIGADIFMKENFNGNGRTCGTCHRVERNFAIDATFIARLPSSDPLFIAENQSDNLPLNEPGDPGPDAGAGPDPGERRRHAAGGADQPLRAARRPAQPVPGHQRDARRRSGKTRRRSGPAGAVTARPLRANASGVT